MVTVLALVFGTGLPAFASHFRASNDTVTYSNGILHWTINEAWRKASGGIFFSSPNSVVVSQNGVTTPGVPSSNLVTTNDTTSNPLYDIVVQSVDINIGAILASPGTYKVYVSSSARVAGVVNTGGNTAFSQAFTFTVNADQSVNLPPAPSAPTLYQLITLTPGSPLTVDYRAADPEAAAVTYSLVTNVGSPDYGATVLPCSTFSGGILSVASTLCTGSENFTTAYAAGTFYAVKARATDPAGNWSEVDTLLRVPTLPVPALSAPAIDHGTATFPVTLSDTYVDTYVMTCTNNGDGTDVITVTTPAQPIVVPGLRSGASYTCSTTGTNALGTGTSNTRTFTVPTFQTQTITFAQPASAHVADGTVTLVATSTSGLPVTYTSTTPAVCTVSGSTVTLVDVGTCSIDADQVGDSTFQLAPTVTQSFTILPVPPAPGALTIATVGPASGTVTIPVPDGDTATLLDGSNAPTNTVTVAGVGTYTLDPATAIVTFVPVAGYSGVAPALNYQITDASAQSAVATIVVTVAKPAAPVVTPVSSTGDATQTVTVTVPAGDTVTLVDAAGKPATTVVVPGEGTYVLDTATGVITFTPVAGATGTAAGVHYRVTDPFGQASTATYAPSLPAAVAKPPVVAPPVVGKASVTVPPLTVAKTTASGVPVTCTISKGSQASCTVVLTATVNGKSVVVGTGKRTVTGTHRSTVVTVKLNGKGKVLAAAPGGFTVTVKASIVPRGSKTAVTTKRSTRIVNKTTALVRPVFFDLDKSVLRSTDVAYLNGLRRHLAGVKSVSCSGYTDNQGNVAYNLALGKQRASATCAYLLRGLHITGLVSTYGLDRPHASNSDSQGQALNRRVTLVLHY
ncbi:hypothetical protein acdb102_40740 [Acidothermaceae bacterium B102]|nr:hypothetical protein acdb102_40740 [Acidothermaceae bacterium B102]